MDKNMPEAPRAEELEPASPQEIDHILMCAIENMRSADRTERVIEARFNLASKLEKLRMALASQPAGEPVVVAYPAPFDGRSKPVSEWLTGWLETCDHHQALVYRAVIDYFKNWSAQPAIPNVDALALHIRKVGSIGSRALAESICNWIAEGKQ